MTEACLRTLPFPSQYFRRDKHAGQACASLLLHPIETSLNTAEGDGSHQRVHGSAHHVQLPAVPLPSNGPTRQGCCRELRAQAEANSQRLGGLPPAHHAALAEALRCPPVCLSDAPEPPHLTRESCPTSCSDRQLIRNIFSVLATSQGDAIEIAMLCFWNNG